MSGAGGGGANDTANQLALDTALQTMILAHARDVCRTRSTCGAAETQLPFPRPAEEKRDASWAIDHLGDPDPNDALATVIATADPTAYPSVRKLASSPGRTRVTALATLGAVRDEGAVDVLRTGLLADDVMARDASAWSLGRLGSVASAVLPQLRAAARDDATFAVRCRAADAIASIAGERVDPSWVIDPEDLWAIGTPPPSGACAEVAQTLCTPMAVEIDGACLVGLNSGDAGGAVATFPKEALETAPHGTAVDGAPTDPLQLVTVGGEPWLVSGRAVHRISRDQAGRLRADKLADLKGVPTWYRVDGGTLVVQTADRVVYRVTKRGAR